MVVQFVYNIQICNFIFKTLHKIWGFIFWQIVGTTLYLSVLHLHSLQTKWRQEACTFKKLSENLKGFIMFSVRNISLHSRFLLSWSTKKYWELFFTPTLMNLKKIYNSSLSYKPNSTANSTHLAALFCPIQLCPQTAIAGF